MTDQTPPIVPERGIPLTAETVVVPVEQRKAIKRLKDFLKHERDGHKSSGNTGEVQEIDDLLCDLSMLSAAPAREPEGGAVDEGRQPDELELAIHELLWPYFESAKLGHFTHENDCSRAARQIAAALKPGFYLSRFLAALTPKEAPAATITSAELIANTDYARGAVRVPGETADRRIYGQPEAPAATGDDATLVELRSAGLRSAGWSVAVHNDYRLNGEPNTFWLWTHPSGRWIKGEGKTDADALQQCIDSLTPRHEAPAEDDDGPCTCCDDTGITIQTERPCACAAGIPFEAPAEGAGELDEADIAWLREASRYFLKRDTKGEDSAFWSNMANSQNAARIADRLEDLRAQPQAREEALGNLLAVIHGDGGHRALEVGVEQAAAEAEKIVARLLSSAPEAREVLERIREMDFKAIYGEANYQKLADDLDALYTHPAAPSADRLRISVEALEESRAFIDNYIDILPVSIVLKIDQALAALKAEGA